MAICFRCHHRSLEESLGIQPKNWGCNKHWFWRASKTATCRRHMGVFFFNYPPKPWVSILEWSWISWIFWMIWGYHPFSDTHFERAERAKVTIQRQITWICSRWRRGEIDWAVKSVIFDMKWYLISNIPNWYIYIYILIWYIGYIRY